MAKADGLDMAALDARIGKVIKGKWTLKKLLGAGGMAAVYEAEHSIGRRDAIKILHPEVAEDEELVARFEREAHAVNRFEHPSAVEIRDVDKTDDGEPFLVMELLEGESLSRLVKRKGRLSVEEALKLAEQLLDCLVAAHEAGVIHRDIKPSNLFLEKDGTLKVLDFGVARVLQGGPGKLKTQAGTLLGTVTYMPPEQLRGGEIDARADLYAVGATLFRLMSGERAHEADSEDELAEKILSTDARSLTTVVDDLPVDVGAVVDKALARDPKNRYPNAATMLRDVRAILAGEDPPFALGLTGAAGGTLVMDDGDAEKDDGKKRDGEKGAEASEADAEADADKTKVDSRRAKSGEAAKPAEDDEPEAEDAASDDAEAAAAGPGKTEIGEPPDLDDATTLKKKKKDDAVDPEAPTVAKRPSDASGKKAEPAEPAKAAPAKGPSNTARDEQGSSLLLYALGLVAILGIVWYVTHGQEPDETPQPPLFPEDSATPSARAVDEGGAGAVPPGGEGGSPQGEGGGEAGEGGAAATPPAGSATATPPAGSATGGTTTKPTPRPGLPPLPSGFPTALPSGFPTALPTSLPTSFPTAIPTSFPDIFPKKPPPPPPPPPAPAP